jgi:hypothetical protein
LPAVVLFAAGPAHAAPILDYRYAGVVTDVYDPYGLFAGVSPDAQVSGQIRYFAPVPPPSFFPAPDAIALYSFLMRPDGADRVTATVGGYTLQARESLLAVYGPTNPGLVGLDLRFLDADTSSLSTAGLPSGYRLFAGVVLGLFTTDFSTSTFPDLPTELLPFGRYDSFAGGLFFVDVFDTEGEYVDSAFIDFRLTSLERASPIPEPTGLAVLGGLLASGVWSVRRRLPAG